MVLSCVMAPFMSLGLSTGARKVDSTNAFEIDVLMFYTKTWHV